MVDETKRNPSRAGRLATACAAACPPDMLWLLVLTLTLDENFISRLPLPDLILCPHHLALQPFSLNYPPHVPCDFTPQLLADAESIPL
jgi:hypothetical protein